MSMTPIPAQSRAVRRHLHEHWKTYAVQGGLSVAIGIVALLAPLAATLASTIVFGWLMLIGGVLGIVAAFRSRGSSGFPSSLLLAVLAAILGAVILFNPLAGAVTLTYVLATFFIFSGIANVMLSGAFRPSTGRFWLFGLSAAIDFALALFLIFGLPGTAVWAVGVFLGVSLVSSGLALLFAALDARHAAPGDLPPDARRPIR